MVSLSAVKGMWSAAKIGAAPYLVWIKVGICVAILAVSAWCGYWVGSRAGAIEVAELKQGYAEETAKIAQLAVKSRDQAIKSNQLWADAYVSIARKNLEERGDAQRKNDAVVAGLLAGTLKLRQHWAGCLPAPAADAAARSDVDAGAELRAADAGTAIGASAECDAQVRGLQLTLLETAQRLRAWPNATDTGGGRRGTPLNPTAGATVPPVPALSPAGRALGEVSW
jgi:hypothetical protein